jgi:riboflavin kinase/FMN adenylyltransferase
VHIEVVDVVKSKMTSVASRLIRSYLSRGEVEKAAVLLGYPYSASGRVVHGHHRGRRLGYPTANISPEIGKILPEGVFWVKVLSGRSRIPLRPSDLQAARDGLCNVGTSPTFTPQAHVLRCEVFLFDRKENLYGRELRVVFMRKIRSERRFSSSGALVRQIHHDFKQAKKWASQAQSWNKMFWFSFTK